MSSFYTYAQPHVTNLNYFHFVVNGGWSEWEPGPCTKTCGGGKMSMIRKCNNPEPACGGNNCVGSDSFPLEAPCNDFCCPGKMSHGIITCIHVLFINVTAYICVL